MHVTHPLIKPGTLALREYQETIFSTAVDANTLVVLPTGLGKTVIAVMLAAHRLYTHSDSKVLFLAPTRPLAVQHHRTFQNQLNIENMVTLTGMDAVEDRKKLWQNNRVIFATPQTIENDIMRGLDLKDVSLIIFDECHRCVGDYAYVFIAGEYMKKSLHPLILGLTASPSSEKETIKEITQNLGIRRVEARTEADSDVGKYVQETKTAWIKVELPEEFKKIRKNIEELLRHDLRLLKEEGFLETASVEKINKRHLLELQAQIRKEITAGRECYQAASLAASALKMNHALELLETQGIASLDGYFDRLRKQKSKAIKRLFADERMDSLVHAVHDLNVLGVDHPKLDKLVDTVKKYPGRKVMIFTQYRDTVEKITKVLEKNNVSVHEFIGQARKGEKKGMSQKKQIEILNEFREGKYNALVATSVAEEGLDIPAVDLVLFYEPIPSEIRSIQRRGRTGRSGAGKVVVLMAKDTRDEAYYWASYHKERRMKSIVGDLQDGLTFAENEADLAQKSLANYETREEEAMDVKEKKAKIYVDSRERCTQILDYLRRNGEIEMTTLEVADYILSDRVAAERKTVEDFLGSLIDKRLFQQAAEISRNFPHPLLIIEGTEDIYTLRGINENAVRGAVASLAIDFGISIIRTENELDTAKYLYMIAKREQLDENRSIALRGERKPALLEEKQRFIVESLPNVSAILARRLLERFGSVSNVMNASKKELLEVEGIGEGKAEEIVSTIRSRYGPQQ